MLQDDCNVNNRQAANAIRITSYGSKATMRAYITSPGAKPADEADAADEWIARQVTQ